LPEFQFGSIRCLFLSEIPDLGLPISPVRSPSENLICVDFGAKLAPPE